MDKFEYMLVKWYFGGGGSNRIVVVWPSGETKTLHVDIPLLKPSRVEGEEELLGICNELGESGWELVSDSRVNYSVKLYDESRLLFKRKIAE